MKKVSSVQNLPAGKYTLRVSAVGYKTQEKAIEVNKDFTAVVHFPDGRKAS